MKKTQSSDPCDSRAYLNPLVATRRAA